MGQERNEADPSAGLSAALSPNALAAVLASDSEKSDPEIARRLANVLDNQARVLHLQAEEMAREDSLRHWSLLVQYTSGVMKVAFELAGALALTALAVMSGVAMYN
ncbi:MAG: hypothetical protein JO167_01895, partial [Alphaproteobacteria bacterium]|nr:hypothetical protein [Alphaproteobacteria bacterium]MBV9905664.1 hypothetical protein [Alphaproteobacteria bacterium]